MSHTESLAGVRVVVTAGPTREPIDPVRYISNRSSGKMGFAVAKAAHQAGAQVTLVSGPVSLATPTGVNRIKVESAAEMHDVVQQFISGADIFIAAAAVADYRPQQSAAQKIKKHSDTMHLELVRNPDILASVAALDNAPFTVGFAAETQDMEANARSKLMGKRLDMIAANQVGNKVAFDQDDNELLVIWRGGSKLLPMQDKQTLATNLVACIARQYRIAHSREEKQ